MSSIPKCPVLECQNEVKSEYGHNYDYCEYHYEGGMFGSGESFEQYQIIEQDFIDFIKVVPLNQDHFNVYSPILRDILLRTCVQIEIFYKEWAKYECANPNCNLLTIYNDKSTTKRKDQNWDIGTYTYFQKEFNYYKGIFVLPLNSEINPFKDWTTSSPPAWWSAYNKVKHNGHKHKDKANLFNVLCALAGLYYLHCVNHKSFKYLDQYRSVSVNESFGKLKLILAELTTPIDSKRYLFRFSKPGGSKEFEIEKGGQSLRKRIG